MHDSSVLVAIDAALRSPAFCACGRYLTIGVHDGAAWLECERLSAPTRLPGRIGDFMRQIGHDRRFVVEVPEIEARARRAAVRRATTGRAIPSRA